MFSPNPLVFDGLNLTPSLTFKAVLERTAQGKGRQGKFKEAKGREGKGREGREGERERERERERGRERERREGGKQRKLGGCPFQDCFKSQRGGQVEPIKN